MLIDKELDRLGFGDISWLWDPEKQNRVKDIVQKYGRPRMYLPIIRNIFQGGARDLQEFFEGYKFQFSYRISNKWPLPAPTPEEYKEQVRVKMLSVALNDKLPYIFCPFMKTRAYLKFDDMNQGFDPYPNERIEDIICYMLEGAELKDFKMTPEKVKAREDYLRKVKILI